LLSGAKGTSPKLSKTAIPENLDKASL